MSAETVLNSDYGFIICIFAVIVIGYFFGSFPTGYIMGRLNHVDIQKEGSGNSGTTNALRTMGVKAGIITFLGDILKAMIPVVLVRILFKDNHDFSLFIALLAGLGVVLGHNFPCWLHFKGGKGIAVTSSVIICIADYRIIIVGLILFILIVALTRYVSLGSLMVALLLPVNTVLFYRSSSWFGGMLAVSLLFTLLAYIRHAANIKRLINGTENKLWDKSKKNNKEKKNE